MKFFKLFTLFTFLIFLVHGQNERWVRLFNGQNLTGWDTYLGPPYDESKEEFGTERFGLNNDPTSVFSVVALEDEKVLRISGEHWGGISTKEEYENYHLQLQFRWGDLKFKPRENSKRDSGLLYHAKEPHGVGWFFWMASQEFQIQEGDCGDYWSILTDIDVTTTMNPDSTFVYDKNGESRSFGVNSKHRGYVKHSGDFENSGEIWNTLDLYTVGGESLHVVNGNVVMHLKSSRRTVESKSFPLTKGKIQLQSEGAEIYFRDIKIRSIEKLPDF